MTKKEVKLKQVYYLVDTPRASYGAYTTLDEAKHFAEIDSNAVSITKVEETRTTMKLKKDKSPWISEQDRLEAMASSLGHEMDKLSWDLSCE